MDICKSILMVALGLLPGTSATSSTRVPLTAMTTPSAVKPCVQPANIHDQEYYQASKQAYLDAGMDNELSAYLATTATAMTLCLWDGDFSKFSGQTCSVELDFSGTRPVRRFVGDRQLCDFIQRYTDSLPIATPPASYLRQHKNLSIEFTPG
ncbi:hypothetical protein SJI19_12950 [Acerihabitans sp. TG2]|uniref:hypothetical protein n=1 Tax=Acerihabitans sp. TG2 TaxID=3096008 RepID=UPI002B236814|nr:hypothetical protein [Acerihabitans sp. TG2]MEA9391441.1 hypothetical protein [Acerihabitans sp. TG2]